MYKFDFKHYFIFLSAQPEIEQWSSWDEEAPTSIKIEGGNGNVSPNEVDEEPDYFKDMAPTIRKTQKVRTDSADDPFYQAGAKLIIYPASCICIFFQISAVGYTSLALYCR